MKTKKNYHALLNARTKKRHDMTVIRPAKFAGCSFHALLDQECPGGCPELGRVKRFGFKRPGDPQYVIFTTVVPEDDREATEAHLRPFRPNLTYQFRGLGDGNVSLAVWNPYRTYMG